MKLYFSDTSPFVRKVRIAAIELGLADQLELRFLRPSPLALDPELSRSNPLNKIPALVLDDGTTLYDSPVIVEYLDSLHGKKRLVPESGPARFHALKMQALCDGIIDAGILIFYERSGRPAEKHFEPWLEGQSAKARQGLDVLEKEAASFGEELDLPQICAAVAIGWLELRKPLGDVRSTRPTLAKWYERVLERPSIRDTRPPT